MEKIPFEIQTLEDAADGKKLFKGFVDKLQKSGLIPGVVYAIGLMEAEDPQDHTIVMLIEGEVPDENGEIQRFNFMAAIPAFTFVSLSINAREGLKKFGSPFQIRVDA